MSANLTWGIGSIGEIVDTAGSKPVVRKGVQVRILDGALERTKMKKYIGYGILGIFLVPIALLAAILCWPLPVMIWLMDWLFDYSYKMEPAGYVCGILASVVWWGILCCLPFLFC